MPVDENPEPTRLRVEEQKEVREREELEERIQRAIDAYVQISPTEINPNEIRDMIDNGHYTACMLRANCY